MVQREELHQLFREMVNRPFTGETYGVETDVRMIKTVLLVSLMLGLTCSASFILLIASGVVPLY